MKLRIKGNSLRLRLTKSDVEKLAAEKEIEEKTSFPSNTLNYSLKCKINISELTADFSDNKIIISIPDAFVKDWASDENVGFDSEIKKGSSESLYILVEKDFQCLEKTSEDQSDNYTNPNKACGSE